MWRQRRLWHTPHDTNMCHSRPCSKIEIFIYCQDTVTASYEYYLLIYILYKWDGQHAWSTSDIRLKSNAITYQELM